MLCQSRSPTKTIHAHQIQLRANRQICARSERLEEAGLEIQSIEPAGNGLSIRSSSPIEETEIKFEIPNA